MSAHGLKRYPFPWDIGGVVTVTADYYNAVEADARFAEREVEATYHVQMRLQAEVAALCESLDVAYMAGREDARGGA